jgi:hypothetical protein
MSDSDNNAAVRRQRHGTVSGVLERMSDDEVAKTLAVSEFLGSGIGGVRAQTEIGDVPVFVKRVPLTERELAPHGFRSTANLFDLPMACHYGIASPGFGAWREVAANEMASRLVVDGMAGAFPILYHWRVQRVTLESADLEAVVDEVADYWRGTPTVEDRIDAIANAPATVLLFFEHIPTTLFGWLEEQAALGGDATDAAVKMVEKGLLSGVDEMQSAGLLHFDAHLDNILTDGGRIYFTDFGLATSPHFQLSDPERRFIADNDTHDRCHTLTRLVDWIVSTLTNAQDWETRDERIQQVRGGNRNGIKHLSPTAAAVIERHAPIAVIINDFYRRLRFDDRHALYPTNAARRTLISHG